MSIACYEYYIATYMGEAVDEKDFPRMAAKAERAINQITHGRAAHFAALPSFQQEALKEAVCAQIEYYVLMGTDVSVNGDTGGNGWAIGEMRINGTSTASSKETGASTMICAAAIAALEQTGLLNPQVPTAGEPFVSPWGWFW
jgi:hypothetical protein